MLETRANPKIVVLLPNLRGGGAERIHVNMAQEWLARGIRVEFVLCQAQGELLPLLPDGVNVVALKAPRFRNAFWPLIRYLRQSRPDALLVVMWPLTVIAPLAARVARFRGRVVVSEHSIVAKGYVGRGRAHHWMLANSMRFAYPLANVRIGVSRGVANHLATLSRLPRKRFTVIYNPAATGKIYAGSEVPAPLASLPRPIILGVGTLKRVKRFDLLIRAFAQLLQRREASLCILGEGDERAALEQQIEQLGLQERVSLPGFVDETGPWYAHADLFVLSSDYEGFGNVIVEALEQGVPVVSTDCEAGPREILADGYYGKLVPVGDPAALADAMFDALAEIPDREALKARARDFSVDKIATEYLSVLLLDWQERCST